VWAARVGDHDIALYQLGDVLKVKLSMSLPGKGAMGMVKKGMAKRGFSAPG
jgi:hypothetical protein